MRPVRAVLFDLDHTLFDTERTERRALGCVARAAGVPLGPKALEAYRVVNTHVWGEYRAGRLTSKELRVLRFHLWLEKIGHDPAPARTLAPLYLDEFSSRGDLISGAAAAVRSVARLGVRMGVVTNGIDRVQRRRLGASDLKAVFPVVVTSERAGFTKPDPRIIEQALRRLRVEPDQAVYIGDDPQVDGLAANRASVFFVWFNPSRAAAETARGVTINHEIAHLREIRDLIRGR
ncbi:MAG: HAD-IA family hydrolase [Vicinamibacteria bacterium]|nr:HAD-IA family hydrolase [Vicinamibacteria bacterium]